MSSYNLETLCMDICVYNFCVQGGGGRIWLIQLPPKPRNDHERSRICIDLPDESRDSCQTFQIVPTFLVLKSLKNNFGAIVDGRLTKVSGPFQRILGFIYNFHSRILLNLPHISTKMHRGRMVSSMNFASRSNVKLVEFAEQFRQKIQFSAEAHLALPPEFDWIHRSKPRRRPLIQSFWHFGYKADLIDILSTLGKETIPKKGRKKNNRQKQRNNFQLLFSVVLLIYWRVYSILCVIDADTWSSAWKGSFPGLCQTTEETAHDLIVQASPIRWGVLNSKMAQLPKKIFSKKMSTFFEAWAKIYASRSDMVPRWCVALSVKTQKIRNKKWPPKWSFLKDECYKNHRFVMFYCSVHKFWVLVKMLLSGNSCWCSPSFLHSLRYEFGTPRIRMCQKLGCCFG